jgi:hypothetical protein
MSRNQSITTLELEALFESTEIDGNEEGMNGKQQPERQRCDDSLASWFRLIDLQAI